VPRHDEKAAQRNQCETIASDAGDRVAEDGHRQQGDKQRDQTGIEHDLVGGWSEAKTK
jgi:hypothetical protein